MASFKALVSTTWGFLGVHFEVLGGGGEITLCLKLGRIMLETLRITANTYVVSENMPVSFKALLILLISAFFCKKSVFFGQDSTFTQSNSVRAVTEIFLVLFSVFLR